MRVAVVNIGEMPVRVDQRLVLMRMCMWFSAVPFEVVGVLMVLAMPVSMVMVQRFMGMRMFMPLADVKPNTHSHEDARDPEQYWGPFRP